MANDVNYHDFNPYTSDPQPDATSPASGGASADQPPELRAKHHQSSTFSSRNKRRRPCTKCGSLGLPLQLTSKPDTPITNFFTNLEDEVLEEEVHEFLGQDMDPNMEDWEHLIHNQRRPPGLRGNLRTAKARRKLLKSEQKRESKSASARVALTFVHDSLELLGPMMAIINRKLQTAFKVSITWTLLEPVHLALLKCKHRATSKWELEPTRFNPRTFKEFKLRLPSNLSRELKRLRELPAPRLKPVRQLDTTGPGPPAKDETPTVLSPEEGAPCACILIDPKFRQHPSGHVWTHDRDFVKTLGKLFNISSTFSDRLAELLSFGFGHRERQRFDRAKVKEQLDKFSDQVLATFNSVEVANELRLLLSQLTNEILGHAETNDRTPTPVTATKDFAKFMNATAHLWGLRRCDKAANNFAFVCEWLMEDLTLTDLTSQPDTFVRQEMDVVDASAKVTEAVHDLGWWFRCEDVQDRLDTANPDAQNSRAAASLFTRVPNTPAKPRQATRTMSLVGTGPCETLAHEVPPVPEPRSSIEETLDTTRSDKATRHEGCATREKHTRRLDSPKVIDSPEWRLAYMTQLVKAHKNPPKLRFLTSSLYCATTRLSKWLQGGLKAIRDERVRLCDHLYHQTKVSLNFTVDESADVLLLAPEKITSINIDDFTRLYTSLPIHDKKEGLLTAIKFWTKLTFASARRRLGPTAALVASMDGLRWEWRARPSQHPLEINVTPELLARCFLVELTHNYFEVAGEVWLQINGLPMGSSTSVDACDLLLGMHEFLAQWELITSGELEEARRRNHNFRFVDDHLGMNNVNYLIDMKRIFNLGKYLGIEDQTNYDQFLEAPTPRPATLPPPTPTTEYVHELPSVASTQEPSENEIQRGRPGRGGNFMDLTLSFDEAGNLISRFYKKNLPFDVIKYQHGDTNAPTQMVHGIIISQVTRIIRLSTDPTDFAKNVGELLSFMTHKKRLDYFTLMLNISRTLRAEKAAERFDSSEAALLSTIENFANVSMAARRISTRIANNRSHNEFTSRVCANPKRPQTQPALGDNKADDHAPSKNARKRKAKRARLRAATDDT